MPIFEFTDRSEVDTAWFLGFSDSDWLAIVYRDGPDQPWRARCRLRRIVDEKDPWESDDTKSVYEITGPEAAPLVEGFDRVAGTLNKAGQGQLTRIEIKGSAMDFHRVWVQQPFSHVRVTPSGPSRPQ